MWEKRVGRAVWENGKEDAGAVGRAITNYGSTGRVILSSS